MKNWYQNCTEEIKKRYGGDWELFVDLLAATSPRKHVKANWRLAERIFKLYIEKHEWCEINKMPGLMPCHTGNVYRALTRQPLSGRKVRAFAANLKGDFSQVTVDVWVGRFYGYEKITNKVYDHIEWVIKQCAEIIGVTPAELQAELWCQAMRAEGKTPKSYLAAIDFQMKLFN